MGNTHSQQHPWKFSHHRRNHHDNQKLSSPSALTNNSTRIITPPLSTKSSPSSRSNSRPASEIGDVGGCVQRMICHGKSSFTLDVTTIVDDTSSNISRSFSAPADLFPEKPTHSNDNTMHTKNGRTYQTINNKYCLPIDEEEQDRLTNTHYVLKHCFGDNFSAPVHDLLSRSVSVSRDLNPITPFTTLSQQCMMIDNSIISVSPSVVLSSSSSIKNDWPNQDTPARALDVACGSGVWVLEMATAFPHSQFYGIDFACVYPNTIKPPNTNFQECDILDPEGFPFPDEYFDYIHMRLVYNCFSSSDLKFVLSEINRVLKPGGYVELSDIDPAMKNPGPTANNFFSDFTTRMSQLHSVDVTWTQQMCEVLSNQGGLTDIHHQEVSVGFGYDGPLGNSIDCSITDALKSYKQFFMEAYDLSSEDCDEKIKLIIQEGSEHYSYFNYYMAWGRKPLIFEQLLLPSGQESPLIPPTPITTDYFSININTLNNMPPAPCESPAELLETAMCENAYDIVHFANGFTE